MSFFEEKNPEIDRYIENLAAQEPEILKRLRRETFLKTTQPHMISGRQQGRFLALISKMLRPQNILEIGTFTGYATLCLTEGLAENGKITTLDLNEESACIAQKYFAESDFLNKIDMKTFNAVDYLKNTDEMFDLAFIDADKENYPRYFQLLKPKLKSGGVLLFDNVLWYGKVLDSHADKKTAAIVELNKTAAEDPDFENVILPMRDGVHIMRKI